jgi:hypothetical protein
MTRDTFDRFQQPERGRFGDNEQRSRSPRVTGASDLIDLTLTIRCEKPHAIDVSDPAGPASRWIWLPKSQIEFEKVSATVVTVTLPEWLAKDKGLI